MFEGSKEVDYFKKLNTFMTMHLPRTSGRPLDDAPSSNRRWEPRGSTAANDPVGTTEPLGAITALME